MDMTWIESTLGRLERQLRELIEGKSDSTGKPAKLSRQIERQLLAAMQSGVESTLGFSVAGSPVAPDEYTLLLPRQAAEYLLTHPGEITWLTECLKAAAAERGYVFRCDPILKVVATPELENIKVSFDFSQPNLGDSSTSVVEDNPGKLYPTGSAHLPKAFLIVNGLITYPINSPVVNIGRDSSNHVCIDDARVSRLHAQLRVIQGKYVIFDLDSTGGTYVNSISVRQQVLNPGDVILLAGVPLVYGQDQDRQVGFTQEMAATSTPPEVL